MTTEPPVETSPDLDAPGSGPVKVGDEVILDIGAVAHGGHCVARWDSRVVFVRHALPGERARVRMTDVSHAGYFRADAVEILTADPRRVAPRCVHFGPGGCGGCDFQHADPELQRELKGAVVAEQLSRFAGIERVVEVHPLPGDGYQWRTRVRWALDADGRIGPRAARSHTVVPISPVTACEIALESLSGAVAAVDVPAQLRRPAAGGARHQRSGRSGGARRTGRQKLPELTLIQPADHSRPIAVWAKQGLEPPTVTETVAGRQFSVAADGFWQAHPAAAEVLSAAVARAWDSVDLAGGFACDLYGGVGLFAVELAERVGPNGTVQTVESDPAASAFAAANLADLPQVQAVNGRVEQLLDELPEHIDAVVLDPPRSGCGKAVCEALAARRPAVIVYVACDPAALARDTATLDAAGYQLDTLEAFDVFPQTHHVECVARFLPAP